jgi:hypothetical protein
MYMLSFSSTDTLTFGMLVCVPSNHFTSFTSFTLHFVGQPTHVPGVARAVLVRARAVRRWLPLPPPRQS